MTIQHYETTDISIGAFFLSKGGDLCGIRIKDAARGIAAFEISGDDLDRLDHEYRTGQGQALVTASVDSPTAKAVEEMIFNRLLHSRRTTNGGGDQ